MTLSGAVSQLRNEPCTFYLRVLRDRLARVAASPVLNIPAESLVILWDLVQWESDHQRNAIATDVMRAQVRILGTLLQLERIWNTYGSCATAIEDAAITRLAKVLERVLPELSHWTPFLAQIRHRRRSWIANN